MWPVVTEFSNNAVFYSYKSSLSIFSEVFINHSYPRVLSAVILESIATEVVIGNFYSDSCRALYCPFVEILLKLKDQFLIRT